MSDDLLPDDEQQELSWISGVSLFDGKPFVHIRLNDRLIGQLTPDQARDVAMHAMGAAEAAEQEALLIAIFGKDEDGLAFAGSLITAMREKRAER